MDSSLKRLEELLIQRNLEGIDDGEARELESLLKAFPGVDAEAFDRTVAAVSLAHLQVAEEMPAELYSSIQARGVEIVEATQQTDRSQSWHASRSVRPIRTSNASRDRDTSRKVMLPWILAAASVALVVVSWWPISSPGPQSDPLSQRAALIGSGATLQTWTATEDATAIGASGDVVWDNELQVGYMRFSRLAANDPGEFQYQLWIFDSARDERYPVDGGVFDIPAGASEIVIPIRASIPVRNPVLFAVTVEAPGGVVVSDRERITLLAEFAQA